MPSRSAGKSGSGSQSPKDAAKPAPNRPSPSVNPVPSAVITGELPVTSLPPYARGARGDGSEDDWYRSHRNRLPAPVAVQFVVWVLFFALLIALLGLSVVYVHPTWVSFLRNVTSESRPLTPPTTTPTVAASKATFGLEASTAKNATYSVPVSSYTIVVTTSQKCWVEVKSPANATIYVFAKTIAPPAKQASVSVKGSSAVLTGSRAVSIEILNNKKVIGVILSPKSEFTYSFLPPSS